MTAGQRWSTERPKVDGYYWWRYNEVSDTNKQLCRVIVVGGKAYEHPETGPLLELVDYGEWCGPLEPPHDQEA